uniref:Uncharacterized protein n=1 Tax=Oryzias melastigma TaxID=30732 RepID=A0A3B3CMV8_ORYME
MVQRLKNMPLIGTLLSVNQANHESNHLCGLLADPDQCEMMGEPHMMVEHKLGLL